ncbi:MAG: methyl-accepting chemotaxis protein [Desulfobacterales bacterium]
MVKTSIKNKIILSFLGLLLIMVIVVGLLNHLANDFYLAQAISTALALASGIFFGSIFSRSLVRRLNKLGQVAKEISQGDLSKEIQILSEDEIRDLEKGFASMVSDLRHMIAEMKMVSNQIEMTNSNLYQLVTQVLGKSQDIDRSAQNIAKGSEEQTLIVQKTSVKLDNGLKVMGEMAKQSAATIAKVNQARIKTEAGESHARQTLTHLDGVLKQMVLYAQPISRLANKIEKIKLIIDVMNDIAQKTDLLSLNASIEATRAGEAGKGFALVASEIRNMAENSRQSSQEIRKMIEDILEENRMVVEALHSTKSDINKGREIINSVVNTFVDMLSGVKEIFQEIQDIEEVTRKQVDQLGGISDHFRNLSRLADENFLATQKTTLATNSQKEDMEKIMAATRSLESLSEKMMTAQQRFKMGNGHPASAPFDAKAG